MPSSPTLDEHVVVVEPARTGLVDFAVNTAMDAPPVPSCSRSTAGHLLAHPAIVHRPTAVHVRGDDAGRSKLHDGADVEVEATITGTAARLHPVSWIGGDGLEVSGRRALPDGWRAARRSPWD